MNLNVLYAKAAVVDTSKKELLKTKSKNIQYIFMDEENNMFRNNLSFQYILEWLQKKNPSSL